jgi:hypothetical protein
MVILAIFAVTAGAGPGRLSTEVKCSAASHEGGKCPGRPPGQEWSRFENRSYGWLRLLLSQAVSGSHSSQSGQARYSGSSKIPRPRV